MRKAYLLVYSASLGNRDQVKWALDKMPEIIHWRTDLPNTFYVISEASASELSKRLVQAVGKRGRFLFLEITSNKQGWLHPDSWYLMNNKKHRPKT